MSTNIDNIKNSMINIKNNLDHDRKSKCTEYIKQFDKIFNEVVKSSNITSDGNIYLPFQSGCSKEVFQYLNKKGFTTTTIDFPNCECARISLDDNNNLLAIPATFTCDYYINKK